MQLRGIILDFPTSTQNEIDCISEKENRKYIAAFALNTIKTEKRCFLCVSKSVTQYSIVLRRYGIKISTLVKVVNISNIIFQLENVERVILIEAR